jgi:hypothetical protein
MKRTTGKVRKSLNRAGEEFQEIDHHNPQGTKTKKWLAGAAANHLSDPPGRGLHPTQTEPALLKR